jgi:hypothetical protein
LPFTLVCGAPFACRSCSLCYPNIRMAITVIPIDSMGAATWIKLLVFARVAVLAFIALLGCWHMPSDSRLFFWLSMSAFISSLTRCISICTQADEAQFQGDTPFTEVVGISVAELMYLWLLPKVCRFTLCFGSRPVLSRTLRADCNNF